MFFISIINVPLYNVIVSKYSLASILIVSSLATFGIAGILLLLPFGNSIVPNGICSIVSPIVARTILYNLSTNYLSIGVGGAITMKSNPIDEYKECLIKAQPLFDVLNFQIND